tara:strand:- start:3143 stop:3514 length:372 start_codon:yes stop_codon:yes gene_type:complete
MTGCESQTSPELSAFQALRRTIRGRCPRCGQGRIFDGYIKQAATCSVCGEPVGEIRADDGPSWLTILMTGPLVMPVVFLLLTATRLPSWAAMGLAFVFGTIIVLLLLPRVKGAFIGVLWLSRR